MNLSDTYKEIFDHTANELQKLAKLYGLNPEVLSKAENLLRSKNINASGLDLEKSMGLFRRFKNKAWSTDPAEKIVENFMAKNSPDKKPASKSVLPWLVGGAGLGAGGTLTALDKMKKKSMTPQDYQTQEQFLTPEELNQLGGYYNGTM